MTNQLEQYITNLYGEQVFNELLDIEEDIIKGDMGRQSVADYLEVSRKKARNIINKVRNPEELPDNYKEEVEKGAKTKFEYKDDGSATVESNKSSEIRTLDDLIETCEINTDVWKINRHVINQWPTTAKDTDGELVYRMNFQVKAWLEPRVSLVSIRKERDQIIEDIKDHAVEYQSINYNFPTKSRSAYEISIFDPHFGKLAWHEETGNNYDSKIAARVFLDAFEDLLSRVKDKDVDEILVPIGNDALHIDNAKNTTTAGTPQDVDTRYQQIFRRARQTYVEALEMASQVAPVKGIVVAGNHDEENIFYLGDSLEGWFSKNPNVSIDNEAKLTKYWRYGKNLTMFNHGRDIKFDQLPFMMAVEKPELWGETKYREVHLGHYHSRQKMLKGESEDKGVIVRVIPSLSATDAWHKKKGYLGNIRAAQGFRYDREKGIRDIYQHNFN